MNDLSRRVVFEDAQTRITVSDVEGAIWINQHSVPDTFSRSVKVPDAALDALGREIDLTLLDRGMKRDGEAMTLEIALEPGDAIRAGFRMILSGIDGALWRFAQSLRS